MNTIEHDSVRGDVMTVPSAVRSDNYPVVFTRSAAQRGSVIVRYSRIERWDVIDDWRASAWAQSPRFKLALAGLVGIAFGAAAVMVFSGRPATTTKTGEASVALSPAIAEVPVLPVREASVIAPLRRASTIAVRSATVAPALAATTPAAAIAPATPLEQTGPASESAALAQAFSSNESVSWRSASNTGTVVVGAAAIENGKYCRDVAILTRAEGAADRTINGRKCLEPGGRIADQAAPTPQ